MKKLYKYRRLAGIFLLAGAVAIGTHTQAKDINKMKFIMLFNLVILFGVLQASTAPMKKIYWNSFTALKLKIILFQQI